MLLIKRFIEEKYKLKGFLIQIKIKVIYKGTKLARLARKPEYIIFAVTIADIKKAVVLKKHTNPAIKVLVEYYKYLDVFL